jgi:polyphenol oxidase
MPPSDSSRAGTKSPTGLVERDGLDVATWDLFDGVGLDALVTTRNGGVSEGPYASLNLALHVGDDPSWVLENRRRALALLGADLGDLVAAEQVHGARVSVVGAADRARGARSTADAVAASDGLVTTEPGLVIGILVADCAPIVLFDPEERVLGCAHAGWRGATAGVVEATIGTMEVLGARHERILAGIGPCIGPDRYEVRADVVDACAQHLGSAQPWASPASEGHWWFDLAGAVEAILRRSGVGSDHIACSPLRTGPAGPFFSARDEGRCGRFALLARITP